MSIKQLLALAWFTSKFNSFLSGSKFTTKQYLPLVNYLQNSQSINIMMSWNTQESSQLYWIIISLSRTWPGAKRSTVWAAVDVLSGHWKIKFVYGKCHSRGEISSGVICFRPHSVVSQKTPISTHMFPRARKSPGADTHTISTVYDTENYNTTTTALTLVYWNVDLERPQNNKHSATFSCSWSYGAVLKTSCTCTFQQGASLIKVF